MLIRGVTFQPALDNRMRAESVERAPLVSSPGLGSLQVPDVPSQRTVPSMAIGCPLSRTKMEGPWNELAERTAAGTAQWVLRSGAGGPVTRLCRFFSDEATGGGNTGGQTADTWSQYRRDRV